MAGTEAAPIAMAATTLLSLFPQPKKALALTPKDLGVGVIELISPLLQRHPRARAMDAIDAAINLTASAAAVKNAQRKWSDFLRSESWRTVPSVREAGPYPGLSPLLRGWPDRLSRRVFPGEGS